MLACFDGATPRRSGRFKGVRNWGEWEWAEKAAWARMIGVAQRGALTLQKLRASGPQKVVVQHVHVEAGGQAVVGNVKMGRRGKG